MGDQELLFGPNTPSAEERQNQIWICPCPGWAYRPGWEMLKRRSMTC